MNNIIAQTIRHAAMIPETDSLTEKGFIENIDVIRKRARQHIEQGAVTDSYKEDRNAIVSLLNDALATELVGAERNK